MFAQRITGPFSNAIQAYKFSAFPTFIPLISGCNMQLVKTKKEHERIVHAGLCSDYTVISVFKT